MKCVSCHQSHAISFSAHRRVAREPEWRLESEALESQQDGSSLGTKMAWKPGGSGKWRIGLPASFHFHFRMTDLRTLPTVSPFLPHNAPWRRRLTAMMVPLSMQASRGSGEERKGRADPLRVFSSQCGPLSYICRPSPPPPPPPRQAPGFLVPEPQ